MRNNFLLDTNILIDFIKGKYKLEFETNNYFISRITYIEILSYQNIDEDKLDFLTSFIQEYFEVIEVNQEISDNASRLGRSIKGLKIADSIILASSYTYEFELVTKDKRLQNYYEKIISSK